MSARFDFYFRPRAIELDGKLYEWLGVLRFKQLLMRHVHTDPANTTANAYALGGRSADDLRAFERRTRHNELIHLAGLAVSALWLCIGVWVYRVMLVPAVIVLVSNFHCYILQRYNRIRILRVLERATTSRGLSSGPTSGTQPPR